MSADDEKTMTIYYKSGYSAGEQYAPHTEKGPYTDVYGICTTMYFMLTGVSPEESVRRILHDRVVPLSKYRDIELPDSAKNAIVKGMAVDIRKRYADVDQLCKDLYRNKPATTLLQPGTKLIFCFLHFLRICLPPLL